MWGETLDSANHGLILENGEFKRDADGNILKTDMNWVDEKVRSLLDIKFTKREPDPENAENYIYRTVDLIPKE